MKTYTFIEDSWWDSNGCSCCEPIEEIYYSPVGFETYTPHSVEDCYYAVLDIIDPSLLDDEGLYDLTLEELKAFCMNNYNFEVEIDIQR